MTGREFQSANQPLAQPILPSRKGTAIAGGTSIFAPMVPWVWGMWFPDRPMTPEIAAAAAGVVVLILGFFYNIVVALLKKLGVDPTGGY